MKQISVCGKRGLGDLVAGISYVLKHITQDTDITFYFPPNHNYVQRVNSLMNCFVLPQHNIIYRVDESWYTVNHKVAIAKFGIESEKDQWFFLPGKNKESYQPFKTQWLGNVDGPIALAINNENTNPNYPKMLAGKWFDSQVNQVLLDLVDDKNYFLLGRNRSIEENIRIMSECRYVLGVDGGWTHVADAMRVPFILSRNTQDINLLKNIFRYHPTLKIIEQQDVFDYV